MDEYKKTMRRSMIFSVLWIILILLAGIASTYAWFSFSSNTNITPIVGKIESGELDLLISNTYDGPFEPSVILDPDFPDNTYTYVDEFDGTTHTASGELVPISTVDLQNYFINVNNDRDGIVYNFDNVPNPAKYYVHGKLYLKCMGSPCDVFFSNELLFNAPAQDLAALRLGMKITDGERTSTYIFSLESLVSAEDMQTVVSTPTIRYDNVVIRSLNAETKAPVYAEDPSRPITDCKMGSPRETALFSMKENVVTTVEYWIYLEGCDVHCIKPAAGKTLTYVLAFAAR